MFRFRFGKINSIFVEWHLFINNHPTPFSLINQVCSQCNNSVVGFREKKPVQKIIAHYSNCDWVGSTLLIMGLISGCEHMTRSWCKKESGLRIVDGRLSSLKRSQSTLSYMKKTEVNIRSEQVMFWNDKKNIHIHNSYSEKT